MALYDHIQELRAELSASSSKREMRQIRRELEAAMAEMANINAAFEEALADDG